MVPTKDQRNCTQQVWETHDAPTASESFSIQIFFTVKKENSKKLGNFQSKQRTA
jgi:hypothetical protein